MNPEKPPKSVDFEIVPSEGETVEENIDADSSLSWGLRLVLTDAAAYWWKRKLLTLTNRGTTVRVPVEEISLVEAGPPRAGVQVSVVIAAFLAVAVWNWFRCSSSSETAGAERWASYGVFVVTYGLVFVFGQRRCRGVTIRTRNDRRTLYWCSPIAFGGGVNQRADEAARAVNRWAERHSLNRGRPRA